MNINPENAAALEEETPPAIQPLNRKVSGKLVEETPPVENDVQSATDGNDTPLTGVQPTEGTDGDEDDEDITSEESDGKIDASKVNAIVKSRIEKIRKKTRATVEAERQDEVEFWKERASGQKVTTDFLHVPPKPVLADYASDPSQYEVDMETWSTRKGEVESFKNNIQNTYNKRCEEFAKNQPDFGQVIKFYNSVTVPPQLEAAILESKNGPKLSYHLAKNFKEFNRISSIANPLALVYELAKIELEITGVAQAASQQKPVPKPMKTVQGGSAPVKTKSIHEQAAAGDKTALLEARKKAHQNTGWSTGSQGK